MSIDETGWLHDPRVDGRLRLRGPGGWAADTQAAPEGFVDPAGRRSGGDRAWCPPTLPDDPPTPWRRLLAEPALIGAGTGALLGVLADVVTALA